MQVLASYVNGNTTNTIYSDGTLTREWPDGETPVAAFPSSIDYSITNYCDAGCPHCHEQSTIRGSHSDITEVLTTLDGLPAGVEMAIGGGNPLDHPEVEGFLVELLRRGLIANMTVNGIHINSKYAPRIVDYLNRGLIKGLGVSYNTRTKYRDTSGDTHESSGWAPEGLFVDGLKINNENTVVHVIAGVHDPIDVMRNIPRGSKILVLGYKNYGFGSRYFEKYDVSANIQKWRIYMQLLMRNYHVSFDNIGIHQFNIRTMIGEKKWSELYMGDDGTFTMYVNGSSRTYATSSTKTRRPWAAHGTVISMFRDILENPES